MNYYNERYRNRYAVRLFAPPNEEPVNLAEAKRHLKVEDDVSEDDQLIRDLIPAARYYAEALLNYAIVTQEMQMFMDYFPYHYSSAIEMPRPPLQSVTHIKYTDMDGVLQTLAVTEYVIDTKSLPGRILPAYGKVWPSTRCMPNAIEIQFKCG